MQSSVKVLKTKKDVPTRIEYEGRQYILDHSNQYKGSSKSGTVKK